MTWNESPRGRSGLEAALAVALFTAFALVSLRPFDDRWVYALMPDLGDPLFNLVILRWVLSRIPDGLEGVWSPPFFHPTEGALTLSDHLLGPSFQLFLLSPLLPTVVAGYNLLLVSSFALSGAATFWVVRRSGASFAAALLAGAAWAFSPFRWDHLSHLAVLLVQWVPVTLYLFDRLLAEPRWRRAGSFLVFYALHVTGGTYLAYMIHFPLGILALNRLGLRQVWARRRPRRILALTAFCAVAIAGPLFLPYLRQGGELRLERSRAEIRHFGATMLSFASPSLRNTYAEPAQWYRRHENALFPGFVPTALSAVGFAAWWRRHRARREPLPRARRTILGALLAVALAGQLLVDLVIFHLSRGSTPFGLTFALEDLRVGRTVTLAALVLAWALRRAWTAGPFFEWRAIPPWPRGVLAFGAVTTLLCFPEPFLLFSNVLPGLDGMRVPTRFWVFGSFALVLFAAFGLDRVLAAVSRQWRSLAGALALLLLAAELVPVRLPWHEVPTRVADLSEVDRWLAETDDVEAVLELPFRAYLHEIPRMQRMTFHGRPIVNGYSGYLPETYLLVRDRIEWLPRDAESLTLLRSLGVSHILFHLDDIQRPLTRRAERRLARFEERFVDPGEITRVYSDRDHLVYRLER